MQIYTKNKQGQKVRIDYTETIVEEKEAKPRIVIDDSEEGYKRFLMCLRRDEEERQYAYNMGDKSYQAALNQLVSENHDLYVKFTNRLRDDLNSRK